MLASSVYSSHVLAPSVSSLARAGAHFDAKDREVVGRDGDGHYALHQLGLAAEQLASARGGVVAEASRLQPHKLGGDVGGGLQFYAPSVSVFGRLVKLQPHSTASRRMEETLASPLLSRPGISFVGRCCVSFW